jgi:hypothetical protein
MPGAPKTAHTSQNVLVLKQDQAAFVRYGDVLAAMNGLFKAMLVYHR